MTDRIPGAPGQYKAVIAETELAKMQACEQFTITMTRDDMPVVEGTPYSKAAVLPDALAENLCPGKENPTPADALTALHERLVESAEYPGCYYRENNGETEWCNPPMETGVEYRTAERWMGLPVYTKLIDFGALPNNEAASIAWGGNDSWMIIEAHGTTSSGQLFPFATFESGLNVKTYGIDLYVAKTVIYITTHSDRSHQTAYITIKYIKEG